MANPNFVANMSSNEIWYDTDSNTCLTDVVDGKAEADHTHEGYAAASHAHSEYAAANHSHEDYAAADHAHALSAVTGLEDALAGKADNGHTHTGFAASNHSHSLESLGAAASNHTHSGYAASSHSHTPASIGAAASSHTHSDYAAASHTHDYAASGHTHTPASIGAAATSHSHSAATTSAAGFMSTSDKSKLDGIDAGANKYTHPAYTAKSSGLYKVTVDATGHVSAATAVTKADITALGIPGSDTNTTYSAMTGATSSAAGAAGLVPAPAAGKQASFLRGDGAWAVPTNTTYSAATTSAAGLMSAADKTKLDGIATGANKTTVDSALSSTSTNPVQNKVINSALAGKAASSHTHSDYFSVNGGTINGETNVAGVLRVNGQQSFYYQTSTASQTVGTNNATGGTTICCGSSANVVTNGANLMTPNCLPKTNNAYYCGNANFRWKGIYSAAAVNVSSDERLKRDIAQLDGAALAEFVEKLNVVSYNYKDDEAAAKARIGLVAQDVQRADAEIANFFVSEDETGMLGLTPADLVFPLIAAVQQLSKRVAELEGK